MKTNKKIIIAITGKSAVGKDTIVNELVDKCHFQKLVATTTREKRPNEINGTDYFFIKDNEWAESKNDIIAQEKYKTYDKNGNKTIWKYGIHKSQLDFNSDLYVCILTPKGVKELKKYFKDSKDVIILPYYIYCNKETRLQRIKERNDNQSEKEIKRRKLKDDIKFLRYIIDIVYNYENYQNENMEDIQAICFDTCLYAHYFL